MRAASRSATGQVSVATDRPCGPPAAAPDGAGGLPAKTRINEGVHADRAGRSFICQKKLPSAPRRRFSFADGRRLPERGSPSAGETPPYKKRTWPIWSCPLFRIWSGAGLFRRGQRAPHAPSWRGTGRTVRRPLSRFPCCRLRRPLLPGSGPCQERASTGPQERPAPADGSGKMPGKSLRPAEGPGRICDGPTHRACPAVADACAPCGRGQARKHVLGVEGERAGGRPYPLSTKGGPPPRTIFLSASPRAAGPRGCSSWCAARG